MATDVLEQNAGEIEMVAGPEIVSQSLRGDRCSSFHAPFSLRPEMDSDPVETKEWVDAFRGVLETGGLDRARFLIEQLRDLALASGTTNFCPRNTPYVNTIPASLQPLYPGDVDLERSITSLIRWNALCMVSQANEKEHGIGGHIATFASAATLYEVAFNHFFKGPHHPDGPDLVYFQGHASPGFYARAFLEGRLTEAQLNNFRRELAPGGGLSSYPHPWLMPDFWQFATVSVGLGPLQAVYQARFLKYLHDRGIADTSGRKVWAFLGDGEVDEPESLAGLSLAAREKLDNLIFVINCNLQRLDGPVRGNGKIIQELEGVFRGAGWNVIKVLWGRRWDPLFERDKTGKLVQLMNETLDGDYQTYKARDGAYVRQAFFGKYPETAALVKDYSDEELWDLNRGGHDPTKVYAAYKAAVEHTGQPTVILAKTIKGYGMGQAGEAMNIAHQQKKLVVDDLRLFRDRFNIPVSDAEIERVPFLRPPEGSREAQYLRERMARMGSLPQRRRAVERPLIVPGVEMFKSLLEDSGEREFSTTMAFVRALGTIVRDKELGPRVVPIVADESRTFGMEEMFRQL